MIDLSILICSLHRRQHLLNRLLDILNKQKTDNIEILIEVDNGEMPIGKKRNILLNKALGKFCCFIDDDDTVVDDYIHKILEAIKTSPDCVGMEGIIFFDGQRPQKFIHTIKCTSWYEENKIFYRNPNHLNPIKTEIARQVRFPEINHGEDADFSSRIKPLLKTEVYIEGPIYNYLYVTNKKY